MAFAKIGLTDAAIAGALEECKGDFLSYNYKITATALSLSFGALL